MGNHQRNFLLMLVLAVGSAGLFYLGREHWAHIFGFLPYALFLVCPLMHFFMHHDHSKTSDRPPSPIQHIPRPRNQ